MDKEPAHQTARQSISIRFIPVSITMFSTRRSHQPALCLVLPPVSHATLGHASRRTRRKQKANLIQAESINIQKPTSASQDLLPCVGSLLPSQPPSSTARPAPADRSPPKCHAASFCPQCMLAPIPPPQHMISRQGIVACVEQRKEMEGCSVSCCCCCCCVVGACLAESHGEISKHRRAAS